jgi:predicted nucleotidyltransferase
MLDVQTEKAVAHVVEQARTVFGPDLVSIALYGSAAGEDFVPGKSDLNFVIVLERVTFAHLQALHRHLRKWHKLGAAMPLLLDRHFLERARDVFPMEFHDIKAQHRVLYGDEVFATLAIDSRHLRYQAEHEARGKLLRLRALYAEVGADRKRLQALMLDSVKTFVIIMRNFIRLREGRSHTRYLQVLDQFTEHFGLTFPTMHQLLQIKQGNEPWARTLDETFRSYLEEVERLIDLIEQALPEPDGAAGRGPDARGPS